MPSADGQALAEIGARIRTLRESQELTQSFVANSVHVTQPAVSQWERGLKMPTPAAQYLLADLFHVQRSWLFAEVVGRAA